MKLPVLIERPGLALREGWHQVRRTPVITAVAAIAVGMSLALAGLFGFVLQNTGNVLEAIERELAVTLYVDDELTDGDIDGMMKLIAGSELVETVTFRSSEEEKARIISLLSEDLLNGVDDEAIPAQRAIEVRFESGELTEARFMEMRAWVGSQSKAAGVEDVGFDVEHIGIIFAVADLVRLTGWILTIAALLVAMLLVATTIRQALSDRSEELGLMRAVGATDAYLHAPYYLGGLLVGVVGAAIAILIGWLVDGRLAALGDTAPHFDVDLALMGPTYLGWCVVAGVAIGLVGPWYSIRRYEP